MKKLLFLFLLAGCYNAPKVPTTDNQKTGTTTTIDTTTHKKADTATYTNLKEALLNPEKATSLYLYPYKDSNTPSDIKHLPAQIGTLINLKVLQIACLENLVDLPTEIGNLKSLEKLIINNGNGCAMNVTIPSSIGNLTNLKELTLYGGLDYRYLGDKPDSTDPQQRLKSLPQTIANLQNLEILDLGRNGLKVIPPQVFKLHNLKVLKLDYNDISVIPSSISDLTNLKELSISLNVSNVKLPESMKAFKGLKVDLIYETLDEPTKKELADQKKLQDEFPNLIFSYSYNDD